MLLKTFASSWAQPWNCVSTSTTSQALTEQPLGAIQDLKIAAIGVDLEHASSSCR
jgi:hypothetical protein